MQKDPQLVRAGLLSLGLHAGAAALPLFWLGSPPAGQATLMSEAGDPPRLETAVDVGTWVDLKEATAAEMAALLRPGDAARVTSADMAPRQGTSQDLSAPAPDTGTSLGRFLPEALRRDASTLRARMDDGSRTYQTSRERTGTRASSPQAVRAELVVGTRDSARSRRAQAIEEPVPAPSLPQEPGSDGQLSANPEQTALVSPGPHNDPVRGEGPLDANRGEKRFDVETPGPARDTRFSRAASNEPHPGRLDLSAAAAPGPGDGARGRGPADTPGSVARPTAGVAAQVHGGPADVERGADLALATVERQYLRYQAELRRRVTAVLRFPKHLALQLEQGETVVRFVVRPDGRLAGVVEVIKSAGFDAFDAEAVSAVTRAAPFPPTSRTLSVSMPIAFDNPIIR